MLQPVMRRQGTTKQVVHTSLCFCEFSRSVNEAAPEIYKGKARSTGTRLVSTLCRGAEHKGDHCQGNVSRVWERKPRRKGVWDWEFLACSGQGGEEWHEGGRAFGTWSQHWSQRWIAKKRPASSGDRSFILKEMCPSCFNNKPPRGNN